MRLIDPEKLKEDIIHEASNEDYLSQKELLQTLVIIERQPTVGFTITAKDMAEYIHSDPEKATKLNEEIRKWGARREV